jgi:hypothetical protein
MGVLGPFALDGDEFAVWLAAILVLGRGDTDDAPELVLAAVVADQHGEELADVKPIALGASSAAVDFDRSGIDDTVVDPLLGSQQSVQLAPGIVSDPALERTRPAAAFAIIPSVLGGPVR